MKKVIITTARKAFYEGQPVIIVPRKVSPFSKFYARPYVYSKDENDDFDKLCNAISYYNCCPELGKTLAYYLPEVPA